MTGFASPWVLDGPINAESFLVYVEQALIPDTLPGRHRGDGNLGSPRQSGSRRNQGHRPPSDLSAAPDLNPIEQVLVKLKHFLREAARRSSPAGSGEERAYSLPGSLDTARNGFRSETGLKIDLSR